MLDMAPQCPHLPPSPPLVPRVVAGKMHTRIHWNAGKGTKPCTVTQMQNKLRLGHTLST